MRHSSRARPVWRDSVCLHDPERESEDSPTYTATDSNLEIARQLGDCVYFIRTRDELIKIGWTSNIGIRRRYFGSWDCVLAIKRGTREDERALHQQFAQALARGREYFHPVDELTDHINEIRAQLGVSPIAA
jgi:hypothetical protein